MSAIVGERDRALRATIPRNINPTLGKVLQLDVDPPSFHQNSAGIPTIPSAKFTATPVGFAGTVLWSITSGGKLTGTTPNERTLLFADMTKDSVTVTASIIYEGQAYLRTKTIYRVTDGANGKDADPANLSPESLVAALEGRITESQLYTDLRTRISLIDSPASVIGSVAAKVKAETDSRVAAISTEVQTRQQAISKEVDDRIAAVLAEAGARTTYVQNYTFSKEETNSALSIQATQIAAAYTAYTDQKTGGILSTAAADVRNYSYSKADTTSAISAAETRLRSEFNAAGGVTQADIQNWSYSKAATDSAEAAQTATLTTSFQGYADQKKSEAMTASAADVRNYAYGKSAVDSAEAAQSATLTTNYTAYADAARTAAVSTASADVRQYTYSKSTVDSSISAAIQQLRSEFVGSGGATEGYVTNYAYSKSQIDQSEAAQTSTITTAYRDWAGQLQNQTLAASAADVRQYAYSKSTSDQALAAQASTLRAEFASNNGVTTAYLENYAYSKAQADSAISQSTQTLVSTVGQNTTAIQQQATTLNGLGGQLTWKIDNNGHVSGFGLASTPINGVPYSTMIFNVDVLGVALPGGTGKPIFTVGQVNGQPQAVFRSDLLVDGGITASKLKIGGSDNIIPDPKFYDLGWWGRTGFQVVDYSGQDSGWFGGAMLVFGAGGGVTRSSTSKTLTTTPGATMRLEIQVELSGDFVGEFSVYLYIEGGGLYSLGGPNLGAWPSGDYPGWPIQFNSGSAKGRYPFSQEITIPMNSQCSNAHMVIVDRVIAGGVAIGSCSATRVADSVLIKDGAITAQKISVQKLSAVASDMGAVDVSAAGYVRSGQPSWNVGTGWYWGNDGGVPKFSVGQAGGKNLYWDGTDLFINGVTLDAFSVAPFGSAGQGGSYPNGSASYGTIGVTVSGGRGPFTYYWFISVQNKTSSAAKIFINGGNTNVPSVTVGGTGTNCATDATATCIVLDRNNRAQTALFSIYAQHGTAP